MGLWRMRRSLYVRCYRVSRDKAGEEGRGQPGSLQRRWSLQRTVPTGAIQLKHFTDEEVLSEIDVAAPEEEITQQIDAAVGD